MSIFKKRNGRVPFAAHRGGGARPGVFKLRGKKGKKKSDQWEKGGALCPRLLMGAACGAASGESAAGDKKAEPAAAPIPTQEDAVSDGIVTFDAIKDALPWDSAPTSWDGPNPKARVPKLGPRATRSHYTYQRDLTHPAQSEQLLHAYSRASGRPPSPS